jgi:hypothetical protein
MKRIVPALALLFLIISLCALPIAVNANFGFGAPTVVTLPATNVTTFSATLNGNATFPIPSGHAHGITPASDTSGWDYAPVVTTPLAYFRYGTSPSSLTSSTPPMNIPFNQATNVFTADIVGLLPCTTYYAQASVAAPNLANYYPGPSGFMTALLPSNLSGLGIGLNQIYGRGADFVNGGTSTFAGNIISFTTPGCSTPTVQHGTGSMGFGGTASIANITVQTAAISSTRVGPGEQVDITATVSNKGASNGATKVTLYINGQEVESRGITVASGQSQPVHFFVTQNDPGTYSVQVGGVSAGSFTVDTFNNNDILIYAVIALFTLGIAGTLFMLTRKRSI